MAIVDGRLRAFGRRMGAALLAAALAGGALAQTAPAPQETFTVRRSPFIIDCAPTTPASEFCRVPQGFNSNDAADRLGSSDFTFWTDGDTLNIAARAEAHEVSLTGSFDEDLAPLSVGRPYWGVSYRLPRLAESVVEMQLAPRPDDAPPPPLVFRGAQAPAAPPSNAELKGRLQTVEVQSAALREMRKVTVYTPPGAAPKGGWPTIIAADGDAIAPYAAILDALIERREIRPVALVAVWPAPANARNLSPRGASSHEYIRGADADSYARHTLFVRREVLPMAQKRFDLTANASERMLFGYGNGADWALETAARDPDSARIVAAFSIPGVSEPPFRPGKGRDLRLYMAAGAYEGPYLKGARAMYNLAIASGAPTTLDILYAGHAPLMWQAEFAKVVRSAFPAPTPAHSPRRRRSAQAATGARS